MPIILDHQHEQRHKCRSKIVEIQVIIELFICKAPSPLWRRPIARTVWSVLSDTSGKQATTQAHVAVIDEPE